MSTLPTLSLTLPVAEPARDTYFCIRMTPAEKTAVHTLAKQLRLPASTLARQLLCQVVEQFAAKAEGDHH